MRNRAGLRGFFAAIFSAFIARQVVREGAANFPYSQVFSPHKQPTVNPLACQTIQAIRTSIADGVTTLLSSQ